VHVFKTFEDGKYTSMCRVACFALDSLGVKAKNIGHGLKVMANVFGVKIGRVPGRTLCQHLAIEQLCIGEMQNAAALHAVSKHGGKAGFAGDEGSLFGMKGFALAAHLPGPDGIGDKPIIRVLGIERMPDSKAWIAMGRSVILDQL
jgi:hypothetical protein